MAQKEEKILEHLSDRPWSDYTATDYSIEQWHASCLIHQHEGSPTSKSQCKLPVKTPNGVVNKNAVHAAAAALAGARGGVNASADEKSLAAKALIRYYHQMNEKPPPSLLNHSNIEDIDPEDFIKHYGVIGMRWGVSGGRRSKPKLSGDYKKTVPLRNRNTKELSDKQIKTVTSRINAEQNYRRLNPGKIKIGENMVKDIMATLGTAAAVYTFLNSPTGKALRSLGRKKINQQLRLFK